MSEGYPLSLSPVEQLAHLDPAVAAELETVFAAVSLEQFQEQSGLGLAELTQQVTYRTAQGERTGTVAAMLTHPECPVGGWVREGFAQEGLAGVQKKFDLIQALDPKISVTISEQAFAREQLKKK